MKGKIKEEEKEIGWEEQEAVEWIIIPYQKIYRPLLQ
jgi:hypothetical protein